MAGVSGGETGHVTPEERAEAAKWLWDRITESGEWETCLTAWEKAFVENVGANIAFAQAVSVKQYFTLKDIYDKMVGMGKI